MTLKKLVVIARDVLSYCGLALLLGDGIDKAFPYAGLTIHQPRWLGYWTVACSIALAFRLRSVHTAAVRAKQQAT